MSVVKDLTVASKVSLKSRISGLQDTRFTSYIINYADAMRSNPKSEKILGTKVLEYVLAFADGLATGIVVNDIPEKYSTVSVVVPVTSLNLAVLGAIKKTLWSHTRTEWCHGLISATFTETENNFELLALYPFMLAANYKHGAKTEFTEVGLNILNYILTGDPMFMGRLMPERFSLASVYFWLNSIGFNTKACNILFDVVKQSHVESPEHFLFNKSPLITAKRYCTSDGDEYRKARLDRICEILDINADELEKIYELKKCTTKEYLEMFLERTRANEKKRLDDAKK